MENNHRDRKNKMEPPTGIGRYLGCEHHMMDIQIEGDFEPRHAWTHEVDKDKLKPPPSLNVQRNKENPLVFEEKGNVSTRHSRGDFKNNSGPTSEAETSELGPMQVEIDRDDEEKIRDIIAGGPTNITTVTYDREGTVLTMVENPRASKFDFLPDNMRHMKDKVVRIITFHNMGVIRDAVLTQKSQQQKEAERLKAMAGNKELINGIDHARIYSTLPNAPRDFKSTFYDMYGKILYESEMHKEAMRYQPLPASCKGMWPRVARMVSHDDQGGVLRDATIFHVKEVWSSKTPSGDEPKPIVNTKKRTIRFMKYDMKEFLEACVDRYKELCMPKYSKPIKHADTPFLDEGRPEFDENPIDPKVEGLIQASSHGPIGDEEEHINSAATSAAPAPKSKAKAKGKAKSAPKPPPNGNPGVLGDAASAVLMKILYAARMGRFDLIRPVTQLAAHVSKWTDICDQKLYRLVCYINSSLDTFMYSWIGDTPEDVEIVLYCDADLSGDRTDGKSTSGVFLCLMGPNTFVPLAGVSKKQTSVSKSTPEAEIVAVDHGVCKEGIPALDLWETILNRRAMNVRVMEDNSACTRVIITGSNPSMRHMSRTQRIDISWLNERFRDGSFSFIECPSLYQAGDIFTKHCVDSKYWKRNLMLIGHFCKGQLMRAGALSVAPADPKHDKTKKEEHDESHSSHRERDDMDMIALAVTSEIKEKNPNFSFSIVRDLKVAYQSGVVKRVFDCEDHDHGAVEATTVDATPGIESPCVLNRLIKNLKSTRIPVGLKNYISEDKDCPADRVIVEYCCSLDSRIGMRNRHSAGCRVIRITEDLDANSYAGFTLAAKGCTMRRALLYSAIPCTGGSSWQFINKMYPSARNKIRKHRIIFNRLWQTFEKLCSVAHACGTYIAIEWPSGCTYWKNKEVKALIERYNLQPVKFHGCALNLKVTTGKHKGKFLKKPWTIYTDCPNVRDVFVNKLCQRNHEHAECRGEVCKNTESYSPDYVACLHTAFKKATQLN